MKTIPKLKSKPFISITAFVVGSALAVAVSVWATSVGTNVSVTGNLSVNGTTGTSTIASGGGFTVGASQLVIQQTSGNVGIGTTSPYAQLSVAGQTVSGFFTATTTTATSTFAGGATFATSGGNFGIGTTSPTTNFTIQGKQGTIAFNNGLFLNFTDNQGNSLFTMDDDGRVGINATTSASGGGLAASLTVRKNTITTPTVVFFADNDGRMMQLLTADYLDGTKGSGLRFDSVSGSGNTDTRIQAFTAGGNKNNGTIALNPSGGNVGIGTTSPSATLGVSTSTATSTLELGTAQSTTRGSCIQLYTPTGSPIRLYATTTGFAVFESGSCR